MTETELLVHVQPSDADDEGDLLDLATDLRAELLDTLDVPDVRPLETDDVPADAKGVGAVVGWLSVKLGSLESVRALTDVLRTWAGRRGRAVEITIDGDTLKLSSASAAEQQRIVDAWIARHSADT